ncbi:THO complex subunit 1-like [Patiria miniata]|uniref:Death domain-containing protein n=1 Tax=Patiria miniata TaxID=46514 RepID=A0A913ZZU8_PATMI|nr:THO complex subunit 1-like [Patiria miniata]
MQCGLAISSGYHTSLAKMAAPTFDFVNARQTFSESIEEARQNNESDKLKQQSTAVDGSEAEKKVALDQAFRDVMMNLVVKGSGCEHFTALINLSIEAVHLGICSPATPFLLLSDVFESVTINICDKVFKFVEERVDTWKSNVLYTSGKNFLLRMCNDLLRRLSKSQNTVFCGRIQLFLARFFPLDEKSGLNLISQFHLDNVTSYNTEQLDGPLKSEDKDETMEVEEGEMSAGTSPIDYLLYRKFWALQDYFRNPTQCYIKDKWRVFQRNTKAVLGAFSSLKLDDVTASKSQDETPTEKHVFFSKYLTSEKLYDLQLNDASFRRYVLLQFLILFQYLNQHVKFKGAQQVLTDDMSQFIKTTTETVYDLLKETSPRGEEFAKTIQHILSREEHWNTWKNEGCQSYIREKPDATQVQPKPRARKRSLGEELRINAPNKKIDMGSPELTRLWNICPDNLEACRAENRIFIPTLEDYFEDAIEQADPGAMIEQEYKVVNNSNFAWCALRLLARRSPYFFQTITSTQAPVKSVPSYLEMMVTKLAKDMPQTSIEELKTEAVVEENDDLLKGGEEGLEKSNFLLAEEVDAVVARLGENWKTLAVELNFTDEEIGNVQTENLEVKEQARAMMAAWLVKEGEQATRDELSKALLESGLNDIIESVLSDNGKTDL